MANLEIIQNNRVIQSGMHLYPSHGDLLKGDPVMTKAKARARAKARALAKAANPVTKASKSKTKPKAGQFDDGSNNMRNTGGKNFQAAGGMRRGSQRSR